jgi:hypothetical protein
MANILVRNTATIPTVAAGDNVYFVEGSVAVTNNTDHSGLASGGIGILATRPEFRGDIGTGSAPLKAEIATAMEIEGSGGIVYYNADGFADSAAVVRTTNRQGLVLKTGGTITVLECSGSAPVVAEEGVATPTVRIAESAHVTLKGNSSSTRPTSVQLGSGQLISWRGVNGTIDQFGGQATWDPDQASAGSGSHRDITTYNLFGGTAIPRTVGTITKINWYGGRIDPRQILQPMVVTNMDVWTTVDRQALNEFLDHRLVTFSNDPSFKMRNA